MSWKIADGYKSYYKAGLNKAKSNWEIALTKWHGIFFFLYY